jgi:hypothetical protein
MITYLPTGRLGNQLQLYACARTLALRYRLDFLYQPITHARQLNFRSGWSERVRSLLCRLQRETVALDDHAWDMSFNLDGRMDDAFLARPNVLYVLKWGGIFKDVREFRATLLNEIVPPRNPPGRSAQPPHHVGLHVRAGDTEHPLPIEYYANAIRRVREYLGQEPVLQLFSDGEHTSIADQLRSALPSIRIDIHRGSAVDDLLQLSDYASIILSKSWFSYWSAFLSDAQAIFAPADFCYYADWTPVPVD